MNALDLLAQRASNPRLTQPAPGPETLRTIVDAALRAPDHALLRAWEILVIEGDGLRALGDAFAAAVQASGGEGEQAERARRKAERAPMILVVAAKPRAHPKVPEVEQILSAGAVAHGLLLGLAAHGFSGMWRTGPMAYNEDVKRALGLAAQHHIVAFLYVGTAEEAPPPLDRPRASAFMRRWPAPRG